MHRLSPFDALQYARFIRTSTLRNSQKSKVGQKCALPCPLYQVLTSRDKIILDRGDLLDRFQLPRCGGYVCDMDELCHEPRIESGVAQNRGIKRLLRWPLSLHLISQFAFTEGSFASLPSLFFTTSFIFCFQFVTFSIFFEMKLSSLSSFAVVAATWSPLLVAGAPVQPTNVLSRRVLGDNSEFISFFPGIPILNLSVDQAGNSIDSSGQAPPSFAGNVGTPFIPPSGENPSFPLSDGLFPFFEPSFPLQQSPPVYGFPVGSFPGVGPVTSELYFISSIYTDSSCWFRLQWW